MKYGALLPHFGQWADRGKIIDGSQRLEGYGFDSVWVRDHLLFTPHKEMEQPNRTFLEALTVLTTVGAVTQKLSLGTGTLIPTRHPLHVAHTVASMTYLLGDRVILGLGAGAFDHEFQALGLGGLSRTDMLHSYVKILRDVWDVPGIGVSHDDEYFSFSNVKIEPKPRARVPIWYCGNSPASVRRAVSYCDGWMPGRISLPTLKSRISVLSDLSAGAGRPRPAVAAIPPTSVDNSRQGALQGINVDGLLAWANKAKYWVRPKGGSFRTVDDLEGVLIAGTPEDVTEMCHRFERAGTDHLVFDLRFGFDRWFEQIDMLGSEVLPHIRDREAHPP